MDTLSLQSKFTSIDYTTGTNLDLNLATEDDNVSYSSDNETKDTNVFQQCSTSLGAMKKDSTFSQDTECSTDTQHGKPNRDMNTTESTATVLLTMEKASHKEGVLWHTSGSNIDSETPSAYLNNDTTHTTADNELPPNDYDLDLNVHEYSSEMPSSLEQNVPFEMKFSVQSGHALDLDQINLDSSKKFHGLTKPLSHTSQTYSAQSSTGYLIFPADHEPSPRFTQECQDLHQFELNETIVLGHCEQTGYIATD